MATKLEEKRAELQAKQAALSTIFSQAGADMDLSKVEAEGFKSLADTAARAAEIKRRNDELTAIGKEVESLVDLQRIADEVKGWDAPAGTVVPQSVAYQVITPQRKSLGEMFTAAAEYKAGMKSTSRPNFGIAIPDFDMKTILETGAGWAPETTRGPRVVAYANRRPMVSSVIPSSVTNQSSVRYMEETTFTNNAAPVAEKGTKPEAAIAWTERTVLVEVIATWIPVTRQQLDDVPAMQAIVNDRLTLMLLLAEEVQLLTGTGVTPQLAGFLTHASVQTQAKGADPTPDAIYKAMTLVRSTGMADPTAVIFHPNDWQDIRLLRTADGLYIWGSPADAGPERIWGVPIIQTTAETENTALTGDFDLYSHISRRMGIQIDVSDSHSDYFIKNQLAIRAEERLSLEIYRPTAFCKVTGI